MPRALCVALFALGTPLAHAMNTWGTDFSDLWWDPAESGWGLNVVHQRDVVFATLFVYGDDGRARWYVGSELRAVASSTAHATFSGELYETSGPPFAGTFEPQRVGARVVGTAAISFESAGSGSLAYSVDGRSALKRIRRQTFRNNALAGSYLGGAVYAAAGCGTRSGAHESTARFTVEHQDAFISIAAEPGSGIACVYTGSYEQQGRMGRIAGAMTCADGTSAPFSAEEVEAGDQGFFARYRVDFGSGCTETGRMGGLKR